MTAWPWPALSIAMLLTRLHKLSALVGPDSRPDGGPATGRRQGLRPPGAQRGPLDVRRRLHRVEH
jgi:hypothetical protein